MMKSQKTKKLFYDKWQFKATIKINQIYYLRCYDSDSINSMSGLNDLKEFSQFLQQQTAAYAKRLEGKTVDIYTNDRMMFEDILLQFQTKIKHCFEPAAGTENLIANKKQIIAKHYPHDRYRYKVFLQPHKLTDSNDKKTFLNFIDNQGEKIRITDAVKKWFTKTSWNWDRRYIYVEDEQMLLMLKLRSADAVGAVYSYVICDK